MGRFDSRFRPLLRRRIIRWAEARRRVGFVSLLPPLCARRLRGLAAKVRRHAAKVRGLAAKVAEGDEVLELVSFNPDRLGP